MRVVQAVVAAFLVLLLASGARAAASSELEFQGERFRPRAVENGGRLYWSLADPEVSRLVSRTAARLQWSSSGTTMVAVTPVRQTTWTPGSEVVAVAGVEQAAPGRLLGKGEAALMEPEALLFALALHSREQAGRLLATPLVGMPALAGAGDERLLRIPLSSAVRAENLPAGEGILRLRFPDSSWGGSERRFLVDDVEVAVSEQHGVVLDLRFPENWQGEIRPGLGLTEVLVACRPTYAFPRQPVGLSKAEFQKGGEGDAVLLYAEAPLEFHWRFDRASRKLTVDLPGLKSATALPEVRSPESGLQSGSFRAVGSVEQPVLRFEGHLAEGSAFEFAEMDAVPGTLILRFGPGASVAPTADAGSASTRGFMGGNGVIVLDPGHGGGDPGCVNRSLGVLEKDVTLDVALRLREILTAQGWTVLMTREVDRDVTWAGSPDRLELQARCDVANNADADFFVSLHCNASVSSASAGTSIHWYKDEDLHLARSLEYALGERLGLEQDGLNRDSFYVLRHTEMPAVLVEMAFLSNPREGSMLADGSFRQRIAQGLAGAIAAHRSGRYARGSNLPMVQSAP